MAKRPVGWLFHLLLLVPVASVLWAFSGPGVALVQVAVALVALLVFGIVWLARLVDYSHAGGERFARFALAPVLVVLVVVLVAAGVPSRTRWALSRPAFDRVAAELAADPDAVTPDRIGLYRVIGRPQVVPGGWIIYAAGGSGFIDDSGFAYLPAGPTPDLGNGAWEGPRFRHLGGPWYSWTASW